MLTPVEEMGLSGLSVASRVRRAFYKIPEHELVELMGRIRYEAFQNHLMYLREGHLDTINVMPCPLTVLPHQLAYVHSVSLTIQNALKRLPDLYFQDLAVHEALRLPKEEEAWLQECLGSGPGYSNPIFGRYDAVVDFLSPMWKDSLHFVEPNMSGIGGLHLVPTAEQILAGVILPVLGANDSRLQLETGQDIRELLMQEVLDHLEALGRPSRNICFVEPKYAASGPDEQEALANYYHDRYGLRVLHADPAELTLDDGEVCYQGHVVDLVYRDYAVSDLLVLQREGVNIEPMRVLLRQNRVISSITAELDQKSCWEVFTDPELSKHFTLEERQIFRRHILWTRILSDRRTFLPTGHCGDLLDYVRRERETLVLKPNRAYGGHGVVLGTAVSQQEWESGVEQALCDTDRWVVQQLAAIPVSEFPVVAPDGTLHVEPFYTVMGFAPSTYGLAILGRASQKQVVNVAQRGGLCAVMLGHPPARLNGPFQGRQLPTSSPIWPEVTAASAARADHVATLSP